MVKSSAGELSATGNARTAVEAIDAAMIEENFIFATRPLDKISGIG